MTDIVKNCKACGDLITVRLADHKRGWGNFCDKACAAAHKCGQRPRDVNARHARYSKWAMERLEARTQQHGDKPFPRAPSIKLQLGKRVKVKPAHYDRTPPMTTEEIHQEALAACEDGWDGHKVWSQ